MNLRQKIKEEVKKIKEAEDKASDDSEMNEED